ncbi:hypothetical protein HYX00_05915 [Candidatus Woesearchaeota archaeon]|nr:hypothetical protein [Candidatus Woesearchaeota archaeon]
MPKQEEKVISTGLRVIYGILGILLASVYFYIGLNLGSNLGDKMAEVRRVSYESYTASITVIIFMISLLLLGYLIYKLIKIKILSKFFLWTLIIEDGLYILFLLFYLSL